MTGSTVFAFPTVDGYQFLPDLGPETGDVLSLLEPGFVASSVAGPTLAPFVKVMWMRRFRFLPRRRALLAAGIVSSGITGEVHRGAYSIWTALRIVPLNVTPSTWIGRGEAARQLRSLFNDFQAEISEGRVCKAFHDAFKSSVHREVAPSALDTVLAEIDRRIEDPAVFSSASFFAG